MSHYKRKYLPPEIIESILKLLPAKSLGRFKSVSKEWNSFISSTKFIKTHILHQKTTKLILRSMGFSFYCLDDLSATGKELIFPSPPQIKWQDIWGSCNGLILAQDENDTMFIMNPITKELWKVPVNPFALCLEEYSFVSVMYGFGYVPSTNDYKIVSIETEMSNQRRTGMFVSVYSLRGNSWRKLPKAGYDHNPSYLCVGALVNYTLHWLTSTRSGCSTVIALSLENEEFNEIQVPGFIENAKAMSYRPLVFGGKLAMFGYGLGYDLWVMEEYGVPNSWTKFCYVSVNGMASYVWPVCLVEGSDRDMVLGYSCYLDVVLVYNIDERRSRKVEIDGVTSAFSVQGPYVETLESPAKIHQDNNIS